MGVYDQGQSFDSLDMQEYEPVRVEDRFAGHSVQRPLNNKSVPQIVGAIACAAFAITCLSGFSYVLFLKPSQGTTLMSYKQGVAESFDDNRATVSLPLYVPELDNRSSRVPIKLSGTTKSGENVYKDTYVSKDGSGLRLEPGSYEISITGMPIASSGVVYNNPGVTIAVEVGEDFSVSNSMSDYVTFSPIAALTITDEQIDAACAFVRADPERTQYTDQLADAARERREEAQKAEEAAKKAREEAERIAAEEKEKLKIVETEADKQRQQQESQPQENNGGGSNEGGNTSNPGGQNDGGGEQQGGGATDGGYTGGGDFGDPTSGSGGSGGSTSDSGGDSGSSGDSGNGSGNSGGSTSGGDSGGTSGGSGNSGTSGGSSETPSGGGGGGTVTPAPAATTPEAAPIAVQ